MWIVGHLQADGWFYLSFTSVLVHDIIWQWQYLEYHIAAIKDKAPFKEVADEDGGRSV
jgi:hypothetical protein